MKTRVCPEKGESEAVLKTTAVQSPEQHIYVASWNSGSQLACQAHGTTHNGGTKPWGDKAVGGQSHSGNMGWGRGAGGTCDRDIWPRLYLPVLHYH